MELVKQHIESYLNSFINDKELDSNLFDKIDNYTKKKRYLKLLNYIDKLIEFKSDNILNTIHLHFENDFDQELENIIFQLMIEKSFNYHKSLEDKYIDNSINNLDLKLKINEIQQNLNVLECRCPEGASAKKGGNRLYRNWVIQKSELRCLLSYYKGLKVNSTFSKKTLINCKVGMKNQISESYSLHPVAVGIESNDFKFCYNIINTDYSLNDIDKKWDFLDSTSNIILFDCETKRVMLNYSSEELNKWNTEYGTKFENYFIITFGNGTNSIKKTKEKIQSVQERFKIKDGNSYTILMSEFNSIIKRKTNKTNIELIGFESSSFWDTFVLETSIRELYELRSIKLMNIYSICFTDEIKDYIIDNLFSKKETSELISSSTKMAIIELRDEDIDTLKEALSNTLDLILNSGIKSKIIESLTNLPTIIFDEAIIRNVKLISKITNCLGLTKSIKLKTWADLLNSNSNYFLILSYRDQGKFPNYYYPNLLENEFNPETSSNAILPNFLFGHHYKWSIYNLLKEYYNSLTHPIREKYFEWDELRKLIQTQKPKTKLIIDWNLENEYSSVENRETYKVKLHNQRPKSYHSSDLIIYSDCNSDNFRIERIKWFFENIDFDESKYSIQKLDELLDEFNPAEKLIDTSQQEIELEIIRNQLGLENESAGRIWKILLKKKTELVGIDSIYEEIKFIFSQNNIRLVSKNTFMSTWINLESDTLMPRGNKIVKALFDFLNLSNEYRRILYRLKNASVSGKIEATKKYSNLLKDLFSNECFDSEVNIELILQNKITHYQSKHSLEELGIDNENPINGLVTLVELIKPEMKLLELETIEKLSNE